MFWRVCIWSCWKRYWPLLNFSSRNSADYFSAMKLVCKVNEGVSVFAKFRYYIAIYWIYIYIYHKNQYQQVQFTYTDSFLCTCGRKNFFFYFFKFYFLGKRNDWIRNSILAYVALSVHKRQVKILIK
jgi:hypothetical protein